MHPSPLDMDAQAIVIGAGFAGSACAALLQAGGMRVDLRDKGRGPGGRSSTRRSSATSSSLIEVPPLSFDHGLPFLTPRRLPFRKRLTTWEVGGIVERWNPRRSPGELSPSGAAEELWVGVPGMDAIVQALQGGLSIRFGNRVEPGWWSEAAAPTSGPHLSPWRIVAVPAPQAADLLTHLHPTFSSRLREVVMEPVWAALLAFDEELPLPFDLLDQRIGGGSEVLDLAAKEGSKPHREGPERWVIQATPTWTQLHLDESREAVAQQLLGALAESIEGAARDLRLPALRWSTAHLWRYARVSTPIRSPFFLDPVTRVGVCGDAFLDGYALLKGTLPNDADPTLPRGRSGAPGHSGSGRGPVTGAEEAWESGIALASAILALEGRGTPAESGIDG